MSRSRYLTRLFIILLLGEIVLPIAACVMDNGGSGDGSELRIHVTVTECLQAGGCEQLSLPSATVEAVIGGRRWTATTTENGDASLRIQGRGEVEVTVRPGDWKLTPIARRINVNAPLATENVNLARLCCAAPMT